MLNIVKKVHLTTALPKEERYSYNFNNFFSYYLQYSK